MVTSTPAAAVKMVTHTCVHPGRPPLGRIGKDRPRETAGEEGGYGERMREDGEWEREEEGEGVRGWRVELEEEGKGRDSGERGGGKEGEGEEGC